MNIFGKKRYPVSFAEFLASSLQRKSVGDAVNPAALLDQFIDRFGSRDLDLNDSSEIERTRFKCTLLRHARRQIDDEFALTLIDETLQKLRQLRDLYEDRDDLERRRENRKQGTLIAVTVSGDEVDRLTAKMAMIEQNMKSGLLSREEARKLLDSVERELNGLDGSRRPTDEQRGRN